MKITPTAHRILVQCHYPTEQVIDLPAPTFAPNAGANRTKVECVAVADDVTVCKVGDFLLLHPSAVDSAIPVSKEPPLLLTHDSLVMGITDDVAPLTIVA